MLAFVLGLMIGASVGLLTLALLKATDKSMPGPYNLRKEVTGDDIAQAIIDADERESWG